jgi:ABC-2 type transport system permease protein
MSGGHPDGSLMPNAGLVARREYVEKIRSRAFAVATGILIAVAVGAALIPIGLRAVDRGQITRIGVVSSDPAVTARVVDLVSAYLNPVPPGTDSATVRPHYQLSPQMDLASGLAGVHAGRIDSLLEVTIGSDGGLDFTFHGNDSPTSATIQRLQVATFGAAVVEYSQSLPHTGSGPAFHVPSFETQPTDRGSSVAPIDPGAMGSRTLLASILVVVIFITLTVYGMWVATSVASEKTSRVMELLISAATPRQLLVGKVVGVGAAGLTQYLAILVPATIVLALQDPIATALIGPADPGEAPLVGLTLPILLAFGFFILGFLLYAFVYAAAGSLVSRPEDIQQLAMPLSFVSMAGYFAAIFGMTAINSSAVAFLSFVPFFSPYVMLSRVMLGHVDAWEIGLSLALLVAAIAISTWIAARIYGAGVLLYGQRPGFRTFLRVAIRPDGG